jgi:hypothetical protein
VNYLLDTRILFWSLAELDKLPGRMVRLKLFFMDARGDAYFARRGCR